MIFFFFGGGGGGGGLEPLSLRIRFPASGFGPGLHEDAAELEVLSAAILPASRRHFYSTSHIWGFPKIGDPNMVPQVISRIFIIRTPI